MKRLTALASAMALIMCLTGTAHADSAPTVSKPAVADSSPAVTELQSSLLAPVLHRTHARLQPAGTVAQDSPAEIAPDPLIGQNSAPGVTPGLIKNILGTGNPLGCSGCTPPDANGDVGPNHYVQLVRATKIAVYNKSGTLLRAPFDMNTLWPAPSPCNAGNDGDPVVLYDKAANRWLLAQSEPNGAKGICLALSKTGDPLGSYWLYQFDTAQVPDSFKFAAFGGNYYMGDNETPYGVYAFERAKMLGGQPARFIRFDGPANLALPADVDGPGQPAAGSPGLFYTFLDNAFHHIASDRIVLYSFKADFNTPSNSRFTLIKTIPIAPLTYTPCGYFKMNCLKQKSTAQRIDALGEWPMYRFPWRKFASYQALAGTFTVGGGHGEIGAAVRWFELHNSGSGWTLFQQGTIDPSDGKDRWLGSIAMNKNDDLAVGYSVTNSTMFPSIRYAEHLHGDPAGTMRTEAAPAAWAGGGAQTASNRWGDYSAMQIDPSDDLTFWYTNEFYTATSSHAWKTRIGKFKAQ